MNKMIMKSKHADKLKGLEYRDEGEYLMIQHVLHIDKPRGKHGCRKYLPYTYKRRVCMLIVDFGSCTNVVSYEMVTKLGFDTKLLQKSYKMRWLND